MCSIGCSRGVPIQRVRRSCDLWSKSRAIQEHLDADDAYIVGSGSCHSSSSGYSGTRSRSADAHGGRRGISSGLRYQHIFELNVLIADVQCNCSRGQSAVSCCDDGCSIVDNFDLRSGEIDREAMEDIRRHAAHRRLLQCGQARRVNIPSTCAEEFDLQTSRVEPGGVCSSCAQIHATAQSTGVVVSSEQLELGLDRIVGPGRRAGVDLSVPAAVVVGKVSGSAPVCQQPKRRGSPVCEIATVEVISKQDRCSSQVGVAVGQRGCAAAVGDDNIDWTCAPCRYTHRDATSIGESGQESCCGATNGYG